MQNFTDVENSIGLPVTESIIMFIKGFLLLSRILYYMSASLPVLL